MLLVLVGYTLANDAQTTTGLRRQQFFQPFRNREIGVSLVECLKLDAARRGPAAAGAVPGVPPSSGAPAANQAAAARSPSDWLAAIERLAGTGEKTAARVELEAFHKAYPDYPVPERLEKLLAP